MRSGPDRQDDDSPPLAALITALKKAAASVDRLAQHALCADPDPIVGLTKLWRERADRHGRMGAPGEPAVAIREERRE